MISAPVFFHNNEVIVYHESFVGCIFAEEEVAVVCCITPRCSKLPVSNPAFNNCITLSVSVETPVPSSQEGSCFSSTQGIGNM